MDDVQNMNAKSSPQRIAEVRRGYAEESEERIEWFVPQIHVDAGLEHENALHLLCVSSADLCAPLRFSLSINLL